MESKSEKIFPYVKLQNQQLRASIESIRYDILELESKLYSIPTVVFEVYLNKAGKVSAEASTGE